MKKKTECIVVRRTVAHGYGAESTWSWECQLRALRTYV